MKIKPCLFVFMLLTWAIHSMAQDNIIIKKDLVYISGDTLKADIYLPLDYQEEKKATLIIADGLGSDFRKWGHYQTWAKLSASHGIVAILYQSRKNEAKQLLEKAVQFSIANSATYSIDPERLSLFGSSANAPLALTFANEERRIKAALILYGTTNLKTFRFDLPVYVVRSGFDNSLLNKSIDTLVFRAMQANAPYTIFNFNFGNHPFEDINDPEKVRIMKASLEFLKENTRKEVRDNFSINQAEIIANKEMYAGNWSAALHAFQQVLRDRPMDNEIELKIGYVYMELKEYHLAIQFLSNALEHGSWRKAEIAKPKCLAYTMLNNIERAVEELRILRKIGHGFYNPADYETNPIFKNVVNSELYKQFFTESP